MQSSWVWITILLLKIKCLATDRAVFLEFNRCAYVLTGGMNLLPLYWVYPCQSYKSEERALISLLKYFKNNCRMWRACLEVTPTDSALNVMFFLGVLLFFLLQDTLLMQETDVFNLFYLWTTMIFVLNRYGLQTETTEESRFLIKWQGSGWGLGAAAF